MYCGVWAINGVLSLSIHRVSTVRFKALSTDHYYLWQFLAVVSIQNIPNGAELAFLSPTKFQSGVLAKYVLIQDCCAAVARHAEYTYRKSSSIYSVYTPCSRLLRHCGLITCAKEA